MKRTDVPMDGIHQVREDLKTLDQLVHGDEICRGETNRFIESGDLKYSRIRTILLGIMATLDDAIVEINES